MASSTMEDLNSLITNIFEDSRSCMNGTIIHIIRTNKEAVKVKGRKKTVQFTRVAEILLELFSPNESALQLIPRIRSVYEQFTILSRNKSRYWQEIKTLLATEFVFTSTSDTFQHSNQLLPAHSPPIGIDIMPNPSPPYPSTSTPKVKTPVKTRNDCSNCSTAKKANIALVKRVQRHKTSAFKLKKSAAAVKKLFGVRSKNQKLKRYKEKIDELKRINKRYEIQLQYRTKKTISSSFAVDELKKENLKLKTKNNELKKKVDELTSAITKKDRDFKEQLNYIDFITSKVDDVNCVDSDSKSLCPISGKGYSESIRRCIYYQLISDVPVNSCGFLIRKIVHILTNQDLERVPSPATCSQMAYELGILSSLQLMEFTLGQTSLTLSWDATTIDGAHVNEVHLTANKMQCLVLNVRQLPGGKSADYVTHIIGALSDAAAIYADFHGVRATEVLSKLKSLITCTLTDRAAVNGAVTRQLRNELESELLLLNCNVHPLDSVARDVKKDLIKFEAQNGIRGNCFGSEGTAANLIKAISVLRYKDGKGDPIGFKNFLHQHNIPVGSFPRYVGNRLHVLFHLAGMLLLHEDKLREFIETQSTAAAALRSSILKDLKNGKIMVQVWALAVAGKTFTGPWMTKFYSSTMSNLEMGGLIQKCMAQLRIWVANINDLLQPQCNVFGERLDPNLDEVVSSICCYVTGDEEAQSGAMESVMMSTLSVLSRQLKDFIDGQYSSLSKETLDKASSAPTHNIASERALGSLDRLWRRAPNATMGFLDGKVRSKMNKTLQWIDLKECSQRTCLINFAMRQAQAQRHKMTVEEVATKKVISERRVEVASKRQQLKKRSVIRELNKVFSHKKDANITFQDNDAALKHIEHFLSSPESVIGSLVFYNNQQMYARIQDVKKDKKFVVSFWNFDESESTSVDFKVGASTFYADVVLRNVIFM